jgi:hypothetical protein
MDSDFPHEAQLGRVIAKKSVISSRHWHPKPDAFQVLAYSWPTPGESKEEPRRDHGGAMIPRSVFAPQIAWVVRPG